MHTQSIIVEPHSQRLQPKVTTTPQNPRTPLFTVPPGICTFIFCLSPAVNSTKRTTGCHAFGGRIPTSTTTLDLEPHHKKGRFITSSALPLKVHTFSSSNVLVTWKKISFALLLTEESSSPRSTRFGSFCNAFCPSRK